MTTAKVRFLNSNMLTADAATVSFSSETTPDFAGANVIEEDRFLHWRVTGAFYVSSLNNNIQVNDGSPRTVSLSVGVYATGTALASQVQTKLNVVSSNWTCTYSTTTGKFTIGRSAGTAILVLSSLSSVIIAGFDMLGYTGAIDAATGTGLAADERRNHTSEHLTVDLGMSLPISSLVVLGASGETFPISSSATLRLRGSDTNNSTNGWTSYDEEFTVTRSDEGAAAFFDEATYRYWQFQWIDRLNPDGRLAELAQIYLGNHVSPTDYDLSVGFERTLVDPSVRKESAAGVLYHRERQPYWTYRALTVDFMADDTREDIESTLRALGRTRPFFIALDPTGVISRDVTEFTKYVVVDDDPSYQQRFYKNYGLNFNLREVIG